MTAVEFYRKHLMGLISTGDADFKTEPEIFEVAKEIEKQQIIDSYEEGYLQCSIYGLPQKSRKHFENSEQYYKEKFNLSQQDKP